MLQPQQWWPGPCWPALVKPSCSPPESPECVVCLGLNAPGVATSDAISTSLILASLVQKSYSSSPTQLLMNPICCLFVFNLLNVILFSASWIQSPHRLYLLIFSFPRWQGCMGPTTLAAPAAWPPLPPPVRAVMSWWSCKSVICMAMVSMWVLDWSFSLHQCLVHLSMCPPHVSELIFNSP